ncbi:hypothetical protein BD779DRAFT_1541427 [Infundibulicybe gibba]|nr:hypothetical protein BD779DRAFT_1541427 [Infundibulicybe gibba]
MDIPSQPIALPSTQDNDYRMGSYTGESGSFNPASYTRHFLGSPISWRPSSFGARFSSSLEKLSSSVDSDRGQFMNALAIFDREGELCRNYNCCGIHLPDLHTLLEHFEQVHIVLDPHAPQPQAHIRIPFDPQCNPPMSPTPSAPVSYPPHNTQFDLTGDMELELDLDSHPQYSSFTYQQPQQQPQQQQQVSSSSPSSGAPSPPDTPISTPLSTYPSPPSYHSYLPTPTASQPPSPPHHLQHPHPHPIGVSNIPFANGLGLGYQQHPQPPVEGAFNAYARFSSDYSSCMPGTQYNPAPLTGIVDEMTVAAVQQQQLQPQLQQQTQQQHTIPPALLFASSASSSRVPSPSSTSPRAGRHSSSNSHAARSARARAAHTSPSTPTGGFSNSSALPSTSSPSTPAPSTSSALPSTSGSNAATPSNGSAPPLLLSKPFRCPKPNCNKSYKQANGLKYHITHGSCNFAPPKDLEHVRDLLAERRRREASASNGSSSSGATPGPQGSTSTTESDGTHSPPQQEGQQYTHPSYPDLPLSESDMRELEREADRRLRPFACGVGDCTRRYKNMNGLRYHYQHRGSHTALGVNTGSASNSTPSTPTVSDSQDGSFRRTYPPAGVRRGVAPLSRQGSLPAILASPASSAGSAVQGQVLHTSPLHTHAMSVPVTPTEAYYSQQQQQQQPQQQGYGYMYAGAQQQQDVGQFAYDYGFVGMDGSS